MQCFSQMAEAADKTNAAYTEFCDCIYQTGPHDNCLYSVALSYVL